MAGFEFAVIGAIEAGAIALVGYFNAKKEDSTQSWDWNKLGYTVVTAVVLGFIASFGTNDALAAGSTGAIAQVVMHQGMKTKNIKLI